MIRRVATPEGIIAAPFGGATVIESRNVPKQSSDLDVTLTDIQAVEMYLSRMERL